MGQMVDTEQKLDYRLVRALREGIEVLPGDIAQLRRYLRMIEALLQEKASEVEPAWDLTCAAAAEIETLLTLEQTVAERAIAVQATSIEGVRGKLAIWRALEADSEDCDMSSARNRLILSIDEDLARIARAGSR
jgi:hypothetical protein